jgi:hypothetical protein
MLAFGVVWVALYVNSSFDVAKPSDYRFFPPFRADQNRNRNDHLGAEYFSIAKSLYAGHGFASPFQEPTGPTAWMPPVLPAVLAVFLWGNGGDKDGVMNAVLVLQVAVLIFAGCLVLALARRASLLISPWTALGVYAAALLTHFTLAFQFTHDCWINLLILTLTLARACFGRPLGSLTAAASWGVFGGLAALVGPVLGFVWGILTVVEGVRGRSARRVLIATSAAVMTVTPWTVRNYWVFGRLIPVKSNLGFELYQSQCLDPDGVLRIDRLSSHPYRADNGERRAYKRLGENAYLDEKTAAWSEAVRVHPWSFVEKIGNRFLAATLVYVPLNEPKEADWYWGLWISRLTHALPFLSALVLLGSAPWCGLRREHGTLLLAYGAYLLPYVLASYYDRYAFPLLGVKALLVLGAADRLLAVQKWRQVGGVILHPVSPQASQTNPMLHRWAAGLLICGGAWWWYGADFLDRVFGPKYVRVDNNVVVPDFFQEWYSARLWWEGQFPYGYNKNGAQHLGLPPNTSLWMPAAQNAHPPGAVFVALPLGGLNFPNAFAVWNAISLGALVGSVWLVATRLRVWVAGWAVLPVLTAVALSNPFWIQITQGQLNFFLLLFLVGAWAAQRSGRTGLAGGLVGVATLVKLFPAYLLVYFMLSGQRRALAVGALTIATGVGLTSAVLGWDVWPRYFTEVVPHTKEYAGVWPNASLVGWWLKLFDPSPIWPTARLIPIVHSRAIALVGVGMNAAGLTGWLWYRLRRGSPRLCGDDGFAAATVLMLLLSPITWDHSFLLLTLPAVMLWQRLPSGPRRAAFWAAIGLLATSAYGLKDNLMLLVGEGTTSGMNKWESPPWLTATILEVHTYALLAFLILLSSMTKAPPSGHTLGTT